MVKRTFDLLSHLEANYMNSFVLGAKENGKWKEYSVEMYREEVDNFSYGLLSMGIQKGDKIATVSNNRPEWNFVDFGMEQIGAVHVPIYPTISDSGYKHILEHSEAKIIIVSNKELYDRIKPIQESMPEMFGIYTFDKIDGARHWSDIGKSGKNKADTYKNSLVKVRNSINENDLVSIIYTSGTTGVPKGVMLSHKNFMSNVNTTKDMLPLSDKDKALSFLPLCHVLERMVNYLYQQRGVKIYYAESIEAVSQNLKEIKPNGFATVPRLLEKVYDKIMEKGRALSGVKRGLFFWAMELGLKYEYNNANGWLYEQKLKFANKVIFSKWREALGGNMKVILIGGAALQPRLARAFNAAQISVQEGYGLTETSPVIAVNQTEWPNKRFGTVGPLIDEVKVKIAEDGEILTKGPNLMLGYYKDPEKTAEAIDKDGWFHTGDIGELSDDGLNILKITDRKKEIFKLSGGKYVAPQVVENIMKESVFIEQLIVLGENHNYTAALISPSFEFLQKWADRHKIEYSNNADLIDNPRVIERYQQDVDKHNKVLGKTEQIKRFKLVPDTWSTESGELSPTQKLRRKYVKLKYTKLMDTLWSDNVTVASSQTVLKE